jgi:hypothetical protein
LGRNWRDFKRSIVTLPSYMNLYNSSIQVWKRSWRPFEDACQGFWSCDQFYEVYNLIDSIRASGTHACQGLEDLRTLRTCRTLIADFSTTFMSI